MTVTATWIASRLVFLIAFAVILKQLFSEIEVEECSPTYEAWV